MTTDWDKMLAEQARIQTNIRQLQKEMGIMPRTLEQRAADWDRRQAEIARVRAQIATAPRIRFPKI
jgi:peptidoglycan hydrolase CwlO-like protein